MNQKIKILSPDQAIKIAAGEVVERPAHIIKELIENSLDAQAKTIHIYLEQSGKQFIKIIDDGMAMSAIDAKMCFAHHATSKIVSVNDLQSITSYGFRGEALSSIASVAHVELITRQKEDPIATHVIVNHGTFVEQKEASHPAGSTFIITQLFDHIPARKKFLKNDETELNAIIQIFQAFALRCINVTFKLFNDQKLIFNCTKTDDIKLRIAQLFNNSLHDHLITIPTTQQHAITVTGTISSMHYHRFNRGQIFIFVNNRWIKNNDIIKSVLKGYDGVLPQSKFPAAFIAIDVHTDQVDINIHPKKEEVKFLHPQRVSNVVQEAIKASLNSQIIDTLTTAPIPAKIYSAITQNIPAAQTITLQNFAIQSIPTPFVPKTPTTPSELYVKQTQPVTKKIVNQEIFQEESFSIVGQFNKTYIIIEKNNRLIMIDQHAAHERILYERFKKQIGKTETVPLLFAHIFRVSLEQCTSIMKFESVLQAHGIMIDRFSDDEIMIQSTPIATSAKNAEDMIKTMQTIIEQSNASATYDELIQILHEKLFIERACKSAIKAGDILNHDQMINLLIELKKSAQNYCCPHGRPTMWTTELKDIEKHFKRDYSSAKKIEW